MDAAPRELRSVLGAGVDLAGCAHLGSFNVVAYLATALSGTRKPLDETGCHVQLGKRLSAFRLVGLRVSA